MPSPKLAGIPPEDHERRCIKIRRITGKRCRKWALRGSKYCKSHGGAQRKRKDTVRTDHLPRFYSTVLKGSLNDFIQECIDKPPTEQYSLLEELALARHSALRAIQLYSIA